MAGLSQQLPPHLPRAPAVPVAFAFAAGVVGDRSSGWPFVVWTWLAVTALLAVTLVRRGDRPAGGDRSTGLAASLSVLALWACLGGMRHHADWSIRGPDNIRACLTPEGRPVRMQGRLHSPPVIHSAERSAATPPWTQVDRTIALLECHRAIADDEVIPVSGLVRLHVTGHVVGPRIGDEIEVFGLLQQPQGRRNPGGFDYARFLRNQGVDAVLRVSHPDHVVVRPASPGWGERLGRWRDSLRREAEWVFVQRLPPSDVPLAISLLLGDRAGIDEELAQAFAVSGTMHLLAISGVNVGIMAGLVHLICRLLQTGPRTTMLVLLVTIVGYACITDQRPPVVRAAMMASIVLAGQGFGRDTNGYQSLALCALAILLYRPAELFDAGAQLSFVAVLAILWSGRWLRRTEPEREWLEVRGAGPSVFKRFGTTCVEGLRQAWVMTGCIWLFTLPLTMWHFHLCSPVGLIANILLIPFTTLMLASGYSLMMLGLAHPLLAIPPATLFHWLLAGLLWIVRESARTPLGHLLVPGPALWWLLGFYLGLALATRLIPVVPPTRAWQALGLWTVAGLAMGLLPQRVDGVRITVLAVGHGGAVLIEAPSERTLLYDAGSFADGRRAQQAIQGALWELGRHRLDTVVVSHADVDHFNALPGLVANVPTGALMVAPSFLDFRQPPVRDTCEAAARHSVPIRLLQAGDRLALDPEIDCTVLHPPGDFRAASDNANSVVLSLTYAGRTVLLTGDLEGAGLERLLSLPPRRVDVLLSPHHGSRGANPPELADWATPAWVIVSASDADRLPEGSYPVETTTVLTTAVSGAIEIRITPQGELTVTPFMTTGRRGHRETTGDQ